MPHRYHRCQAWFFFAPGCCALGSVRLRHDFDDFPVGLAHSIRAEAADIAQRVFDSFGDQSLTAVELLSHHKHLPAKDTRIHRQGDLGRAGGFGAVADNTGSNRQGVDQR
ncbi:hypothetical protein SDC9_116174 [bioreactor metagenome]|uniref:Uncharacterized protein n=1 Tax=bioreactor metagenome TaxID=1076179 RepID=A0A645BUV6_9ZZZZ